MEERKVATVVFADLTGSTELADREDPERTRKMLDRFSAAMTEAVTAGAGPWRSSPGTRSWPSSELRPRTRTTRNGRCTPHLRCRSGSMPSSGDGWRFTSV